MAEPSATAGSRPAARRTCGCKVHNTRVPRPIRLSWRGGMPIIRMLHHACGREFNRIVVRGG